MTGLCQPDRRDSARGQPGGPAHPLGRQAARQHGQLHTDGRPQRLRGQI